MNQLSLFEAPPAARTVLEYGGYGQKLPWIQIELAPHDDGRWMWATSLHRINTGFGYSVSPKWNKFAASYAGALEGARREVSAYLKEPNDKQARSWLEAL